MIKGVSPLLLKLCVDLAEFWNIQKARQRGPISVSLDRPEQEDGLPQIIMPDSMDGHVRWSRHTMVIELAS